MRTRLQAVLPPYALLAAAFAWHQRAHGWRGALGTVVLVLGYGACITYKYHVQTTRAGRGAYFFQHGTDFVTFVILALVLAIALFKLMGHHPYWGALYPAGLSGGSGGIGGSGGAPRPLFTVQEDGRVLNVSSILGTMQLTLAAGADAGADAGGTRSASGAAEPTYSFCDASLHGLSLLDYALFSLLVYLDPGSEDFAAFFKHIQAQDDWVLVEQATAAEHGVVMTTQGKALEFFSASRATSVIAVRGTNPMHLYDVFQDILIFHRAFTFDLTAQVRGTTR